MAQAVDKVTDIRTCFSPSIPFLPCPSSTIFIICDTVTVPLRTQQSSFEFRPCSLCPDSGTCAVPSGCRLMANCANGQSIGASPRTHWSSSDVNTSSCLSVRWERSDVEYVTETSQDETKRTSKFLASLISQTLCPLHCLFQFTDEYNEH